jgi:hypothetical protein
MDISEYLVETNEHYGGVQRVYKFPNGYGASVIRHKGSYGYSKGLWELAVLDEFGGLDYTTSITNDVLGHLSEEEVILKLNEIRGLQTS